MTEYLGRPLNKGEIVHHIDFNSYNNKIENLQLLPNQSEHIKIHHKNRIYRTKDLSNRRCFKCESDKTLIHKNGRPNWYKYGMNYICDKCYDKLRYNNAK